MKFTISVAMSEPEQYMPMAQAAEANGYHAIAVPDSIFYSEEVSAPYPYTRDGERMWDAETPWIEPWVAIPAMAAVTKTIRFYTNVLKVGVRNPLLIAKTVGSAAVLSNNRVALGAGLGWLPEEFKWCGTTFENRGKRVDEALEIIRKVLAGGMVEFHGECYDFGRLQMSPAPSRQVPIYVGGHTEPGLRRAARYDGWASAMTTEKQLRALIDQLQTYRAEAGRTREPFEIQAVCTDVFDVPGYRRLQEAGVTDVIYLPWLLYGHGLRATLAQKVDGMKRFADEVIAKLH